MQRNKSKTAIEDLLSQALSAAHQAGATSAEAIIASGVNDSVTVRRGEVDGVDRAETDVLGFRLFVDDRAAMVSTSDLSLAAMRDVAEKGVAIAREMPADPTAALAEKTQLATEIVDFDSVDKKTALTPQEMIRWSLDAEAKAMADERVAQSHGAGFTSSWSQSGFASSQGFFGYEEQTSYSGGVGVVASQDGQTNSGGESCVAHHFDDVKSSEIVGLRAQEKACEGLGAIQLPSTTLPIFFDRDVATSFLGHFLSMINGDAVVMGTTLLKDAMNTAVFGPEITIVDDPHRKRGFGATSFDGEGLPTQRLTLVEQGVLKTWLLDLKRGRKLDLPSTGHASRGVSSAPSPGSHDPYIQAGTETPEALLKKMGKGIFVTGFMGSSVNDMTGDYSRGMTGFLVEGGEKVQPLKEMTISGNLKDIFAHLLPANDLVFERGMNSPSLYLPHSLQVSGG